MLQEMHSQLKIVLAKDRISIPVIYGCDEYSDKIQKLRYDRSKWGQTALISGDFSDAYTKSNLVDLDCSIRKLGQLVGWKVPKINLATGLAKLVFEHFSNEPQEIFEHVDYVKNVTSTKLLFTP